MINWQHWVTLSRNQQIRVLNQAVDDLRNASTNDLISACLFRQLGDILNQNQLQEFEFVMLALRRSLDVGELTDLLIGLRRNEPVVDYVQLTIEASAAYYVLHNRLTKRLSQRQTTELTGIDQHRILDIERLIKPATLIELEKFVRVFGQPFTFEILPDSWLLKIMYDEV